MQPIINLSELAELEELSETELAADTDNAGFTSPGDLPVCFVRSKK